MKTRIVASILALGCASSAAAQSPAVAPAQQVQPDGLPPASAAPAAPALPPAPPAPAPPAALPEPTPRGYVPPPPRGYVPPPPQRYAPPPYVTPSPTARQYVPRMPDAEPPPPRIYGDAGAPLSLGIGGALIWRDEDHRRFGNDDFVGAVNAFASYDVWAPSRTFVLAAGLDYRHDERARTSLGELKDNLLTADLSARLRVASWLWPQLRAGLGVAITHVGLKDSAIELDDRDADVAGSFGGGLLLRTPTRAFESHRGRLASLSFGVLIEAGYTLAPDAKLTPEPARGGEVRRATPASFSAERSAAYLRFMAVTRF